MLWNEKIIKDSSSDMMSIQGSLQKVIKDAGKQLQNSG